MTKEQIKTDLKAMLVEAIEQNKVNIAIYDAVESVLKTMEGKPFSKRIETAVKKILPDYIIAYSKNYGMFHLRVWGNGIDWNHSINFLLGYNSNPFIQVGKSEERHSGFAYFSNCYGQAEKDRMAASEKILNNEEELERVSNLIAEISAKQSELGELLDTFGKLWNSQIYYSMKSKFNLADIHDLNKITKG